MVDLIEELKTLHNIIVLKAVICDSPAQAFVKCTKSHSGYSSCDKCTVHGSYDGCVIFDELDSNLRTDNDFRSKSYPSHHNGSSPFLQLPIDMVKQFPLNYMHVVCLEVVCCLLLYWTKGPLNSRLSSNICRSISYSLMSMHSIFPAEFSRKPRSLEDLKFWKAAEFRTFLLYSGVVALKDNVSCKAYNNFCCYIQPVFFYVIQQL